MLEISKVSKRYGGLSIFSDVSFDVAAGSILGLIGPNGAGKSTLFNIVTGFAAPNAGQVRFQGDDITGFVPEKRARLGIARTFQIVKPFNGLTVLENVMVGAFAIEKNTVAAKVRADRALERIGLGKYGHLSPENLTLPDRKRMEFARCLATEPKLLLLDEVMCGLNPTEIDEMVALIHTIKGDGITIVLVEHLMDVITQLADDVIVLSSGSIISRGAPATVLKDPQVIKAYLGGDFDAQN